MPKITVNRKKKKVVTLPTGTELKGTMNIAAELLEHPDNRDYVAMLFRKGIIEHKAKATPKPKQEEVTEEDG